MSPQNLDVEILKPNVIVLDTEPLEGGLLSHEDRALMNGTNALKNEAQESSFTPSTMRSLRSEEGPQPTMLAQ